MTKRGETKEAVVYVRMPESLKRRFVTAVFQTDLSEAQAAREAIKTWVEKKEAES